MITKIFLTILIYFIKGSTAVLGLLHIPTYLNEALSWLIVRVMLLNEILPVYDVLICISAILTFNIVIYAGRVIGGVISLFRGGGDLKL